MFDKINLVYRNYLLQSVKWQLGSPVSGGESQTTSEAPTVCRVVIEQSDMYTNVLSSLADCVNEDSLPSKSRTFPQRVSDHLRGSHSMLCVIEQSDIVIVKFIFVFCTYVHK